jgi:hypothetical protein
MFPTEHARTLQRQGRAGYQWFGARMPRHAGDADSSLSTLTLSTLTRSTLTRSTLTRSTLLVGIPRTNSSSGFGFVHSIFPLGTSEPYFAIKGVYDALQTADWIERRLPSRWK